MRKLLLSAQCAGMKRCQTASTARLVIGNGGYR